MVNIGIYRVSRGPRRAVGCTIENLKKMSNICSQYAALQVFVELMGCETCKANIQIAVIQYSQKSIKIGPTVHSDLVCPIGEILRQCFARPLVKYGALHD